MAKKKEKQSLKINFNQTHCYLLMNSVAKKDTRWSSLEGIKFEIVNDQKVRFVATDTHICTIITIDLPNKITGIKPCVFTLKAFKSRLINKRVLDLSDPIGAREIIDAKYPNWKEMYDNCSNGEEIGLITVSPASAGCSYVTTQDCWFELYHLGLACSAITGKWYKKENMETCVYGSIEQELCCILSRANEVELRKYL